MTVSTYYYQSCPCCNRKLRIEKKWLNQDLRCSHCAMQFHAALSNVDGTVDVSITRRESDSRHVNPKPARPVSAKPVNQSVLLVDNDREFLCSIAEVLDRNGMIVTAVHHPRMAISAIRVRHYAVAILNSRLPEMNGLELMRALKSYLSGLQVIILSGNSQSDFHRCARAAGAFACLNKSCDPGKLRTVVESALQHAQAGLHGESPILEKPATALIESRLRQHVLQS